MARFQTREAGDGVDVLPLRILIVDANPDMRLYLRSCMRGMTAPVERVVDAADGLVALRLVRSGDVDLVIAHVAIPGLDGRRLRRAIHDDPTLGHVAVLLFDADAAAGEPAADGVLAGPFNGHGLLAALDGLPRRG